MKIVVMGTGFVGLAHAAVCSKYGHEVYGYDIDPRRLEAYPSGNRRTIELFQETMGRYLFFTSDLAGAVEGGHAIFSLLPAPCARPEYACLNPLPPQIY